MAPYLLRACLFTLLAINTCLYLGGADWKIDSPADDEDILRIDTVAGTGTGEDAVTAVFKVFPFQGSVAIRSGSTEVSMDGYWARDLEPPMQAPYNGAWPLGQHEAVIYFGAKRRPPNYLIS